MRAVISPSVLLGSVAAPPSKSYAHRLLIGAFLSGEGSTVHGIQESEDLLATLDCLRTLGGKAELTDGSEKYILEAGDANYCETGNCHGIRNIGESTLIYLGIKLPKTK